MSRQTAETCVVTGQDTTLAAPHTSLSLAVPRLLGASSSTALTDATDACARATQRWQQVLAEQHTLLSRLMEKTTAVASASASPFPASDTTALTALAAAGLPIRLLHVRVQSNLGTLDTHVQRALAPFAQFQRWQSTQPGLAPPSPPSLASSDTVVSQTCQRASGLLSELHELCDLQAEATRGFDQQLRSPPRSPAPTSYASSLTSVLEQMCEITRGMQDVSDSLWTTLQSLLLLSPVPARANERDSRDGPPVHQAAAAPPAPQNWLQDVTDTNETASLFLENCLSPPSRHGSRERQATTEVLIASPSPLARQLCWPAAAAAGSGGDGRVSDDEEQRRRSHSVASTSGASPIARLRGGSLTSASQPRATTFPSLSPWRPEDESELLREGDTRLSPSPLTTRLTVNTQPLHTVKSTERKAAATPQGPLNGFYTTRDTAAPSWSIPPPLVDRRTLGEPAYDHDRPQKALQVPPSTIGAPSLDDVDGDNDAHAETRSDASPRLADRASSPHRHTQHEVEREDEELDAERVTAQNRSSSPSDSSSSSSSSSAQQSPPSPLTHQALQALRTSYDHQAARLEAALHGRETALSELQKQKHQQQQQPVPTWPQSAVPWPAAPWYGLAPLPYPVPSIAPGATDEATNNSIAELQRGLEELREQQSEILSLLKSTHDSQTAPRRSADSAATDAPPATTRTIPQPPPPQPQVSHPTTMNTQLADTDAYASQSNLQRIQARNERLQRDNIQLKKRLFALELDMRRSGAGDGGGALFQQPILPSATAQSSRQNDDDRDAIRRTDNAFRDSPIGPASRPLNEDTHTQRRRRAVLDKLFSLRTGRHAPQSPATHTEENISTATVTATSDPRPSFFAQHPSFPFTSGVSETVRGGRASSAPPSQDGASRAPAATTAHPYASTSMASGARVGLSRGFKGLFPSPAANGTDHVMAGPMRASSSPALPLLRHHAWRLGQDDVEEAALELLSRPIGQSAPSTAQLPLPRDRNVKAPNRTTSSTTTRNIINNSNKSDGGGGDGGLSPLQAQRARVWRSLHTYSTTASESGAPLFSVSKPDPRGSTESARRRRVAEESEDVSVSPLTEARSPTGVPVVMPQPAPASSTSRRTDEESNHNDDDDDDDDDDGGEDSIARRFPLPAYMTQRGKRAHHASHADDDGGNDRLALEPTVLQTSPSPPPQRLPAPHRVQPSRHSAEVAYHLFDPLQSVAATDEYGARSPPPRSVDAAVVERRLTLSHSPTASSEATGSAPTLSHHAAPPLPRCSRSSSSPPPNGASAAADTAARSGSVRSSSSAPRGTASVDLVRGRSRTLPPPPEPTRHPARIPVRRGHAREDLERGLAAERAELTATLQRLESQQAQIREKRQTVLELLDVAAADPVRESRRRRTSDLNQLLERLDSAAEGVAAKTAQLDAQRDHVSQQLRLVREDIF